MTEVSEYEKSFQLYKTLPCQSNEIQKSKSIQNKYFGGEFSHILTVVDNSFKKINVIS